MSKATASSHNQIIISIETPHVKMPGVQILRPEEIKALAEKEQKDQRNQKLEGKWIDIIKYDFIVKKEDIEAGVLGNTPENPKKNKDKRPMTARLKKQVEKNKEKAKIGTTTLTNFKVKKTKEKVKNEEEVKQDEENKENLEEPNEQKNKNKENDENDENNQNEENNQREENNEINKEDKENNEKNENVLQVEEKYNEETYEKVENDENEQEEQYDEEIEDEEIEEDDDKKLDNDDDNEKSMSIDRKSTAYQSSMANVKFFIMHFFIKFLI